MKQTASYAPISKAIRIVRTVAERESPSALAELSRAVELPKPTAYRLCSALERAGMLARDAVSRRYRVSESLETLAFTIIRNSPGHLTRRLHMEALSERIGERINLGVLSRDKALYVEWVETASSLRIDVRPDTRLPIHASANGKLLLAYSPPAIRRRVLAAGRFPALTPKTITSAARLAADLEAIRQRGWAEDDEEFSSGIICLAVPVRNRRRQVVAGLALMAPAARLSLAKARAWIPDLRASAEAISADLAATGSPRHGHATPTHRGPKEDGS